MFNGSDIAKLFGATEGEKNFAPTRNVAPARVERYRAGQLPSYVAPPSSAPPITAMASRLDVHQNKILPREDLATPLVIPTKALAVQPPPQPFVRTRVEASIVSTASLSERPSASKCEDISSYASEKNLSIPTPAVPAVSVPMIPGLCGEEDALARRARIREKMLARPRGEPESAAHLGGGETSAPNAVVVAAAASNGEVEAEVVRRQGRDDAPKELVARASKAGTPHPGMNPDDTPPPIPAPLRATHFRPVFLSRAERGVTDLSVGDVAPEEEEERVAAEAVEARVAASRELLAAQLAREEAEAVAAAGAGEGEEVIPGRPDDTDRAEEAEADARAWQFRELKRVAREVELKRAAEIEAAEVERRRRFLSGRGSLDDGYGGDVNSKGGNRGNPARETAEPVVRFHHRGAFYMDDDTLKKSPPAPGGKEDVRLRRLEGVTELEAMSIAAKSLVPAAARVKAHLVGRRGQGRYTTLAQEDTTRSATTFRPPLPFS